jgi:hypothetical protein
MNTQRIFVRALTGGTLVGALLLGMGTNHPGAWAEETALAQASQINQSLAGARTGMLTQANGSTVRIDNTNYVLAAQAALEDVHGNLLEPADLVFEGGDVSVQFWLGTGPIEKQITQMLVTFPE